MYFFDTYALVEITNGNPAYARFAEEEYVTSALNMGELYYAMLKKHNAKTADHWLRVFLPIILDVPLATIVAAVQFRYSQKKNFSLVDCIGYAFARECGLIFLTGDKVFKGLPGAEVVT